MSLILIDGNYMAHRAMFSGNDMWTNNNIFSGGTYIFLKILWSIRHMGTPIVVFDGARATWRKELLPTYKERVKEGTAEEAQRDIMKKRTFEDLLWLLPRMEIPTIQLREEADDVIYRLAESGVSNDVIVASDDSDYLQMVQLPHVRVFQPMKERWVAREGFRELIGVSPEGFTLTKALQGDTSDAIPGVSGIGVKTAQKIVNELPEPTLEALWDWANAGSSKTHDKVRAGFGLVKRNMQLVDLRNVKVTIEEVTSALKQARWEARLDFTSVRDKFAQLEFLSLDDSWLAHLYNLNCVRKKT